MDTGTGVEAGTNAGVGDAAAAVEFVEPPVAVVGADGALAADEDVGFGGFAGGC
jgi:hypothetical protein